MGRGTLKEATENQSARLEERAIHLGMSNTAVVLAGCLAAPPMVYWAYWPENAFGEFIFWFVCMLAAMSFRTALHWRINVSFRDPVDYLKWRNLMILSACFTGAAWGMLLPLSVGLPSVELQAVSVIIIVGVTAATVSTTYMVFISFIVFEAIIVICVCIGALLTEYPLVQGLVPLALIFFAYLTRAAWLSRKAFEQASLDQFEAEALATQLQAEKLEMERLNAALTAATAEAVSANHAKTDFLTAMSHELRTPLNTIMGYAQLIGLPESKYGQDHLRRISDDILYASRHLLDMITDILDLAAVEAGKIVLEEQAVRPGDMIDEAVPLIQEMAARNQLTFARSGDSDRAVQADPKRLRQVLLNLISNAAKYNRPGGHFSIQCQDLDDDHVRIAVSDTGCGIAAEDRNKIFQQFSRLSQNNVSVEGTGVGLYFSKQLIDLMGGRIDFVSEVGSGSTFYVDLPVAVEQIEASSALATIEKRRVGE